MLSASPTSWCTLLPASPRTASLQQPSHWQQPCQPRSVYIRMCSMSDTVLHMRVHIAAISPMQHSRTMLQEQHMACTMRMACYATRAHYMCGQECRNQQSEHKGGSRLADIFCRRFFSSACVDINFIGWTLVDRCMRSCSHRINAGTLRCPKAVAYK